MAKLRGLLWLGLIVYSSVGLSARLASYCVLEEDGKEVKEGLKTEERMPLASVSKVFTTFLAVNNNQISRKIYTQFFYTLFKDGVYDVHIRGGHEPYFGRQNMHWLIAKLNEAGVTQIRNLSFDENFKYYHDTDHVNRVGRLRLNPVSGKDDINAPSPEQVRAQLLQNAEVLKYYDKSVKEAQQNGVQLPKKITFRPTLISFIPSTLFAQKPQTKKGYVASADILHMLKLMNWNSNNHAANQMFEFSGGVPAFKELFYKKLGLSEKDVLFVNGSGQNANLTGDGREYNEATCSTVVKTVRALKKALEAQKAKLQDALAVVGGDMGSTVGGKTYTTALTKMSVIAKTGTVGTNITLAGMISSQTGNHFFFYNVDVNSAPSKMKNKNAFINREAGRARAIIAVQLNQLVKKLGGPKPIEYTPKYFDLKNFEDLDEAEDAEATAD